MNHFDESFYPLTYSHLGPDYMGRVDSVLARLQPGTRSLLHGKVQPSQHHTNPLSTWEKKQSKK